MKKMVLVTGLIMAVLIVGATTSFGGTLNVQFPMKDYNENDGCLEWGDYNSNFKKDGVVGRHVGDDVCRSVGTNILAIADGVVKFSAARGTCESNWVYLIVTEHTQSDGSTISAIYGHVQPTVLKDIAVKKGQPVGIVAPYPCSSPHLHFGIYNGAFTYQKGDGYPVEAAGYMYGSDWPGKYFNPSQWIKEKVIEYRQFAPHAGKNITDVIGNPEGSIGWYYPAANPITNEIDASGDDKGMSLNVYVQNYPGKACTINNTAQFCDGAIVYDALGGARSAYLVWYQQFGGYSGNGGWYKPGGPHSAELRNPITNSYWSSKDNCWRQDFQMGWLCYENRKPYDSGDVAPGVYDPWGRIFSDVRRWDAATSYAFAEAYERNGAAVNLGSVYDDGGTVFVHNWTINSLTILIQNFSGGNFGSSAIIYNPSNGNAYNIRTGFWEYYKNNSGPSLLGPPKEDEHGNGATQPCNYIACQKFERGELYWNGNSVVAYIPDPNASGGYGTNWRPSPSPDAPLPPMGLSVQ